MFKSQEKHREFRFDWSVVTLIFLGTTCTVGTHPPQGILIMPLILFAKFVMYSSQVCEEKFNKYYYIYVNAFRKLCKIRFLNNSELENLKYSGFTQLFNLKFRVAI